METKSCPSKNDKKLIDNIIVNIVKDTGMKLLDKPHIYYVDKPKYGEGLTAIAPIQTSHISFHFWKYPEIDILHNPESKCLLEFDIYTCGSLTMKHIERVLHHLSRFEPTHVNGTLLNRKYSLTLDKKMRWNINQKPWNEWLKSIPYM
jgi:S-adenosylmethionine/arginine decarboxylase-like enzyme